MSGFLVRRSRIVAKAEAGHYVLSGKLSEELNDTYPRTGDCSVQPMNAWLSNWGYRNSSIADWGCGTQAIAVTSIDATAREQHPTAG